MCVTMRSLLYHYFVVAAVTLLLLIFTSLWLPQGTVQYCESMWLPCLTKSHNKVPQVLVPGSDVRTHSDPVIGSDVIRPYSLIVAECPGQQFQVSHLLLYLDSALSLTSDVLLEPYLLCWEELIKFMDALGPLVSFFTYKVQEKVTLIRQLAKEDSLDRRLLTPPLTLNSTLPSPNAHSRTYHSVRSMLESELRLGVVSFDRQTLSGSRTLLRLHRSLLWLQLLLRKLWLEPGGVRRSLAEVCEEAYSEALAPHHPWLLQRVARLAFKAMPEHTVLLNIVCVNTHQEAEPIIRTIVTAIGEVRHRTQTELEKRHMLELP